MIYFALIVWLVFSIYYILKLKDEIQSLKHRDIISIPLKREPRDPSDSFRDPPKFSSLDEDKSSW